MSPRPPIARPGHRPLPERPPAAHEPGGGRRRRRPGTGSTGYILPPPIYAISVTRRQLTAMADEFGFRLSVGRTRTRVARPSTRVHLRLGPDTCRESAMARPGFGSDSACLTPNGQGDRPIVHIDQIDRPFFARWVRQRTKRRTAKDGNRQTPTSLRRWVKDPTCHPGPTRERWANSGRRPQSTFSFPVFIVPVARDGLIELARASLSGSREGCRGSGPMRRGIRLGPCAPGGSRRRGAAGERVRRVCAPEWPTLRKERGYAGEVDPALVAGRMWNSAGGPTAPRQQQALSLIAVFIAGERCGACCAHPGSVESSRTTVALPPSGLRASARRGCGGRRSGGRLGWLTDRAGQPSPWGPVRRAGVRCRFSTREATTSRCS